MLSPVEKSFAKKLKASGMPSEEIEKNILELRSRTQAVAPTEAPTQAQQKPQEDSQGTGFVEDTTSAVNDFQKKNQEITERVGEGQGLASTTLQNAGNVVDLAADTAFAGAKSVIKFFTPDAVERGVVKGAKALGREIADTDIGQKGLQALSAGFDKFKEFKESNPIAAANLEGGFQLTDLIGLGVGSKAGKLALNPKSLKKAAKTLKERQISGLTNKLETQATKMLDNLEFLPKGAKQDLVLAGKVVQGGRRGLFKQKDTLKIDKNRKKMIDSIKHHIDPDMSILDNIENVRKANSQISEVLEGSLAKMSNTHRAEDVLKQVRDKMENRAVFKGDETAAKAFKSIYNVYKERIDKIGSTTITDLDLYKVRKAVDKDFSVLSQKLTQVSDFENVRLDGLRQARSEVNNIINDSVGDNTFKQVMERQTNMFNATEELSKKYVMQGSTYEQIVRKIKQSPVTALAIGGSIAGSAAFAPLLIPGAVIVWGAGKAISVGGKTITSKQARKNIINLLDSIEKGELSVGAAETDYFREVLKKLNTVKKQDLKPAMSISMEEVRKVLRNPSQ